MKRLISVILSILLLLPVLVSCGETPAPADGSSEPVSSYHEDLPGTEPVDTGDADPFEDAEPLPSDLQIPEALKNADGTVLGTIVLPDGARTDKVLCFAAAELRYHIQKVTGADLPVVKRTGYG